MSCFFLFHPFYFLCWSRFLQLVLFYFILCQFYWQNELSSIRRVLLIQFTIIINGIYYRLWRFDKCYGFYKANYTSKHVPHLVEPTQLSFLVKHLVKAKRKGEKNPWIIYTAFLHICLFSFLNMFEIIQCSKCIWTVTDTIL